MTTIASHRPAVPLTPSAEAAAAAQGPVQVDFDRWEQNYHQSTGKHLDAKSLKRVVQGSPLADILDRMGPVAFMQNPALVFSQAAITVDQAQVSIMYAQVVLAIQGCTSNEAKPRRSNLKPPGVEFAYAGAFSEPRRPAGRDPLIVRFNDVVLGGTLLVRNRAVLGESSFKELPIDTLAADAMGNLTLAFSDEWMRQHNIRPGDPLEFAQKKGTRTSKSQLVVTNPDLDRKARRNLIPADHVVRVGNIPAGSVFTPFPDDRLPNVDASQLETHMLGERVFLSNRSITGDYATFTEPRAKLTVTNLSRGASGETTVADDGSFRLAVRAEPGDALLLRVADHSGRGVEFERRLTLTAGQSGAPVVANNPSNGARGPVAISPDKIGINFERGLLAATRAVTPGSIVTLINGETEETTTAVADAEGCFTLPFTGRLDDIYTVRVRNPFDDKGTTFHARVASEGLEVVGKVPPVPVFDTAGIPSVGFPAPTGKGKAWHRVAHVRSSLRFALEQEPKESRLAIALGKVPTGTEITTTHNGQTHTWRPDAEGNLQIALAGLKAGEPLGLKVTHPLFNSDERDLKVCGWAQRSVQERDLLCDFPSFSPAAQQAAAALFAGDTPPCAPEDRANFLRGYLLGHNPVAKVTADQIASKLGANRPALAAGLAYAVAHPSAVNLNGIPEEAAWTLKLSSKGKREKFYERRGELYRIRYRHTGETYRVHVAGHSFSVTMPERVEPTSARFTM